MATASRITVPIEARDLVSGTLRRMQQGLRSTQDDVGGLRRAADRMGQDFISSTRRAGDSAKDLGAKVGQAADETRQLGRAVVGDLFRRAKSGAETFRRTVSRASSDVKGMPDAHVRLHADDQISPLIDNISAKISGLAALGSGLVLGGGVSDAMFGGVLDYSSAVARSAAFLPEEIRSQGLKAMSDLYKADIISNRTEGASLLADAAPLMNDRSQSNSLAQEVAKAMFVRPDSSKEENLRAISQVSNVFGETPAQANDSINYTYSIAGDKQQDIADSFWEYSGFFKNAGRSSGQMANYFAKMSQDGAYNYDKPGDFFKEVFGVKALNTDDMTKYFESRGSGKKDAVLQAEAFTSDINSANDQKAQGAIMALIADLKSQNENELKQSLTQLGSATAEDNGAAILKNFAVPFEPAPAEIVGTTDRMISAQQKADPFTEYRQTRNQMSDQMQDIGGTIMQASVPAMKEFNSLLVENKGSIEAFGSGVATGIGKVINFYKEHTDGINLALMGLASVLVIKGAVSFTKGIKQLIYDIGSAGKWIWKAIPGRKKTGIGSSSIGGSGLVSSMNVNAKSVYVNGSVGGGGGSGKGKGKGKNKGKNNSSGNSKTSVVSSKTKQDNSVSGKNKNKDTKATTKQPKTNYKTDANGLLSTATKGVGGAAKGVLKGLGVLGTMANVGFSAYDLYGTAKEQGWREAISTQGGSTVGSLAGGTIGGILGSLVGPLGTAAGAAVGSWAGEKLGALADSSGITRGVVDAVAGLTDKVKGLFGYGKKEEVVGPPPPPPKAEITISAGVSTEGQTKIKETMENIHSNIVKSGLRQGLSDAIDQSGVTKAADEIKDKIVGMFKGSDSKEAESNVKAVGTAAKETEQKAKDMGVTAKNSSKDVVSGNGQAASSFNGVAVAARSAVSQARSDLMSLSSISSQGSTWGSNLISMMASGMQSKFPTLTSVVSNAAGIMKKFLGFASPTDEGPASNSDKWAPNFVSMFADGLRPDSIRERMNLIAGTMRDGVDGMEGPSLSGGNIPIRTTPLSAQTATAGKSVTIGNITMDLGGLAAGITDFQSFAKAMTSPEGRALIRNVFGEELYKALETGG